MSTITIIEGNNNDKDNTRAFMVKGEQGHDAKAKVTQTDNVATLTLEDEDGTTTATVVSPLATVVKQNSVATITITDINGTTTANVQDGAPGYEVPANGVIGWDSSASIPAGYEEIADSLGAGLPTGAVTEFAGSTAPLGYLLCDGSAISRTTYSQLFAVIGTTYGAGDGETTFNIPNIKGKTVVGLDSNDTDFDTLGETGGEKTHTLIVDEMPSHSHTFHAKLVLSGSGSDGTGLKQGTDSRPTDTISSTGGGQAHNNLQPYIVLNYIIKY